MNQAAVGTVHLICALRDKKLLLLSISIWTRTKVVSSNFSAPSSRLPTRKIKPRVIAEHVPTLRLLGRKGFCTVIVQEILRLIIRGGSSAVDVFRIPLPQLAA
jgi:hypothetical protein